MRSLVFASPDDVVLREPTAAVLHVVLDDVVPVEVILVVHGDVGFLLSPLLEQLLTHKLDREVQPIADVGEVSAGLNMQT